MTYDTIAAVRTIIEMLQYLGLWSGKGLDALHQRYVFYARALHFAFTFPLTIMMWIEAARAEDFDHFCKTMFMLLIFVVLCVKILNIWYYSGEAFEFFITITEDDSFALSNENERQIWKKPTRFYRYFAFAYIFSSIIASANLLIGPLFSEEYELAFPCTAPFDYRNERYFWFAYVYELIAEPLMCLSNCGLDMIQSYMLLHVSLCFRLVGVRLARLGRKSKYYGLKSFKKQSYEKDFIETILFHQKVIRLCKQCEAIVSFSFLVQIICCSGVLCFSAFRLQQISLRENPSQFIAFVLVLLVITLQMFLPCYCGNEIMIQSYALTNAIYSSDWYEQPATVRKSVFIYMEFLKKTHKIRVGKFFDIGLPLFTKIMNATYNLMAVLINMNK